jgi:hypothetical protein
VCTVEEKDGGKIVNQSRLVYLETAFFFLFTSNENRRVQGGLQAAFIPFIFIFSPLIPSSFRHQHPLAIETFPPHLHTQVSIPNSTLLGASKPTHTSSFIACNTNQ